jgi:hypothetical protein
MERFLEESFGQVKRVRLNCEGEALGGSRRIERPEPRLRRGSFNSPLVCSTPYACKLWHSHFAMVSAVLNLS